MSDDTQDRAKHVTQMLINLRLDGVIPDDHHLRILQRYIEGTATLSDLLQDARQFALMQQLEDSNAKAKVAYERLHAEYEASNAKLEKEEPTSPEVTALVDAFWRNYRP